MSDLKHYIEEREAYLKEILSGQENLFKSVKLHKAFKPVSLLGVGERVLMGDSEEKEMDELKMLTEKLDKLRRENEMMKEALSFYSNQKNWKSGFSLRVDDTKLTETNGLRRGGKRAREVLKQIKGE